MPTFTVSSGSGRSGSERVIVYPERESNSSRSASVHSPTTSESRSFSSSNDSEGWTEIEQPYDDGIEPSDSASRAKQSRSRRHTTEARPAPTRRHSSRRLPHQDREREREREELPRHHSSHRPRERRHHRTESRRTPSDESSSTVASADDYSYSHHGMQPQQQRGYPPSGFRHAQPQQPLHSHGGYPPSMTGAPGYQSDPFQVQAQALVHMPHQGHDPFGYPSSNPFSPGAGAANNPFSPMNSTAAPGYFPDPHAPPMPQHMQQHQQRPPGPSHRGTIYTQSSAGYPVSELVPSPYQHPGMQGIPPGMQNLYPGYPMQGYQQMPVMYPPPRSPSSPPAPAKEEKKEPEVKEVVVEKKDDAAVKELESLRELIKKHEEERVAREQAIILKAEADKAAAAAEKKKQDEIAAASAAAKAEAEKAASEVAMKAKEESDAKLKEAEEAFKKAKEESDKKLADAEKAKEAEETKKKALEEEIEKNKPVPDMLKAPIKFKDAVGRKFSFPWHLCKTWKGMETLIKQAFLHVDLIGQHVHEGHYDLTGPEGEIILPQVWDTMIKPDWEVSMHMWPMPEPPKKDKPAEDAAAARVEMLPDQFANFGFKDFVAIEAGKAPKKGDKKSNKKSKHVSAVIDVPVAPANLPMAPPPPPANPPNLGALLGHPPGPLAPMVVTDEKKHKAKAKAKSKDIGLLAAWIAGSSGSRPKKR